MKDKPILFSGEMVRAILDGRKTQTRRIVKVQPPEGFNYPIFDNTRGCWMDIPDDSFGDCWPEEPMLMPYQVGDRLWVRETFGIADTDGEEKLYVLYKATNDIRPDGVSAKDFGAERAIVVGMDECEKYAQDADQDNDFRWRPSIHMPRWASRITLEVVAVRVERLQDISEDDAVAEGLICWNPKNSHAPAFGLTVADVWESKARNAFFRIWDTINGKRAPWASNPWVWVIEFKKVEASS